MNGAWTQLLTSDAINGFHTVAIDPFNPSHIVVVDCRRQLERKP